MNVARGEELVFLPLGGSGEIGMNLNAYGFGPPERRQWIVVDIGVTFGREEHLGVELILPDPAFLEEERENILGIVLTHAHEDHIGALPWLWPRLKAPVYATPFTAALVREKLREHGLLKQVPLHEVSLQGTLALGPFGLEFVTLTHSIPEPNGLLIRTPLGVVWHTGDWKIDPDPLIGEATDEMRLQQAAEDGVLAMVCDSTNVFVEGRAGSEAGVRTSLVELVARATGKVAVTAFASNVARLESAMHAAARAGRAVCLVGRSMHRISGVARDLGLLQCDSRLVTEEEAVRLAPEKILYLCTGSQGEERAALARIARGDHRQVSLSRGDLLIFSSRVIPGNEAEVHHLYNEFLERGVEIITDQDAHVHVSGHPCRDELSDMYRWVRPRIAVPVHGERRHLAEHAKLALSLQVGQAIAPRNGDLIRLAPGPAAVIDETPAGRLAADGSQLVSLDSVALKERRRLGADGLVTVALALGRGRAKLIGAPQVKLRGLALDDEDRLEDAMESLSEAAEDALEKLRPREREEDAKIEAAVQRAVRRTAETIFGKRPFVDVLVLDV